MKNLYRLTSLLLVAFTVFSCFGQYALADEEYQLVESGLVSLYDAQNNIVTMPTGSFEAGVLGSYEYTIKISWDINDNNYELSQEIDIIRIFIDSTQVGGA